MASEIFFRFSASALMSSSRFLSMIAVGSLAVAFVPTASAQMAGGANFGGMQGMHTFSPVTGAAPTGGGMSSQQQMAQIYMLYGMLGGAGGGNVTRGPSNPFANGGFGMGSMPYLDSSTPAGNASSAKTGSAARKAALRAQRAEQKNQGKLAKVKVPKVKPASKSNPKKNVPALQ